MEFLQQTPEAITPVYLTESPNSVITLFRGVMTLSQGANSQSTDSGTIELRWLPSSGVYFEVPFAVPHWNDLGVKLEVPDLNLSSDVSIIHRTISMSGETGSCRGIIHAPIYTGKLVDCRSVLFHVVNFRDFIGEWIKNAEGDTSWAGRLFLKSSDWEVIIDRLPNVREDLNKLKAAGGYALTHTGAIARVDGHTFSHAEAQDTLTALTFFLTFTNGRWCAPLLALGRDNNDVVWEEWSIRHVVAWKSVSSWCPYNEPQELTKVSEVFYGFMSKWETKEWSDAIRIAIHWYAEANTGAGGVEGSIVLTQTALELLGWVYLVEDPLTAQMSAKKFNDLAAAEKIRRLLSSLGIPTNIPSELKNLVASAGTSNAVDGPDAFVSLRNGIVHPKQSKRNLVLQTPILARLEANELGLWYLELALLALFGYKGRYYSRFINGHLHESCVPVPWI